MDTLLQIFISIFFVYGLYCAILESLRLSIKLYRFWRRRIDKKQKKG